MVPIAWADKWKQSRTDIRVSIALLNRYKGVHSVAGQM